MQLKIDQIDRQVKINVWLSDMEFLKKPIVCLSNILLIDKGIKPAE